MNAAILKNNSGLGSYGKQIEWNTPPAINTYSWNRDGYWDCSDWIAWHGKVEEKYGLKRANEVFMIWWNKQPWYAYAQDCYLFNQTFRNFWKKKGLDAEVIGEYVTKPFDFITGAQKTILDTGSKVIDSAGDAAVNAGKTGANLTMIFKTLIPVAVVAVVGGVGYYVYKNYLKGSRKVKIGPATV